MSNRWIVIILAVLGVLFLAYGLLTTVRPQPGLNPAEPFIFGAALLIAAFFVRRRLR
jgi:hypothetical protein